MAQPVVTASVSKGSTAATGKPTSKTATAAAPAPRAATAPSAEDPKALKLREQTSVRASVELLRTQVACWLDALASLFELCAAHVGVLVPSVVASVWPMAGRPHGFLALQVDRLLLAAVRATLLVDGRALLAFATGIRPTVALAGLEKLASDAAHDIVRSLHVVAASERLTHRRVVVEERERIESLREVRSSEVATPT